MKLASYFKDQAINLANKAAQETKDQNKKECLYRTALSRAYYSCFHEAMNRVISDGWMTPDKGPSVHKGVRICVHYMYCQKVPILGAPNSETTYLHTILNTLRRQRNDADYNTRLNINVLKGNWSISSPLLLTFHGHINTRIFKRTNSTLPSIDWSNDEAVKDFLKELKRKKIYFKVYSDLFFEEV